MPDKWQEINLRLDAELAHALRELKRGHDESLAEVVLRLLRKAVRQNPGQRGVPEARSRAKGARNERGGFGGTRRGPTIAREARGASRGPARGKPFAAREVTEGDTWVPAEGKLDPARGSARTRAPRPFTTKAGKAFRPQQGEGGGERRQRAFAEDGRGAGAGERPFRGKHAGGAKPGRMPGRRKTKGRKAGRG
jgi:hypothetical protein